MAKELFSAGDVLVSNTGDIVIDEVVPRSRALLVHPEDYIKVEFDPNECAPPPCAGGAPDEVRWELYAEPVHHHHHHGRPEEELRLKIRWHVNTARTILWEIKIPV